MIAKQLSVADMAALSVYYAKQTPPTPRELQAGAAPKPGGASTRTGVGIQPAPGTGSEGGAPTAGGSQGPGGGGGASGSGPSGGSGGTP